MKLRKFLCALILALFSLQTLNFTALADEGMWPFNNVPRAEIKKKYGFDVTDEWLRLRSDLTAQTWLAALRGAGVKTGLPCTEALALESDSW